MVITVLLSRGSHSELMLRRDDVCGTLSKMLWAAYEAGFHSPGSLVRRAGLCFPSHSVFPWPLTM